MTNARAQSRTVLVARISVARPVAGLAPADEEHLRQDEELAFVQSVLAVAPGCQATRVTEDYLVAVFQDCDDAFNAAHSLQQICMEPGRSATLTHMRLLLDLHATPGEQQAQGEAMDADSLRQEQLIRQLPPDWIFATAAVIEGLSAAHACRFHSCEQAEIEDVDVSGLYRAVCHEDATTRLAMPALAQEVRAEKRSLSLRWRKNTMTLGEDTAVLTLGRGEQNDITIESDLASRVHARLGFQQTNFILTDQSTNGTFVQIDDAAEVFLHHEQIVLRGRGVISLGRRITSGRGKLIYFSLNA